jgi:hypothetical protein
MGACGLSMLYDFLRFLSDNAASTLVLSKTVMLFAEPVHRDSVVICCHAKPSAANGLSSTREYPTKVRIGLPTMGA